MKIIVVGGGVFGLSAAVELRGRGHEISVFDRCQLPAHDGSSNDLSRIIRMDYGGSIFSLIFFSSSTPPEGTFCLIVSLFFFAQRS